jgi:ATP/maltotriose-dependent transcriptional regulator MalT
MMGIASILAERADPEAVSHAQHALTIARELGSADQLLATLATAAMVAWQVGAVEEAARAVGEAESLLHGPARISRVVLATAAAGVALAGEQLEDAARLAEIAVRDGEELGVDRELPLAHAVRARIAVARGRHREAAQFTLDAFASAARLDYRYPAAICLETAATVLGVDETTAGLLATAAELRRQGDRPAPPSLQVKVPDGASSEPLDEAVARAVAMLEG